MENKYKLKELIQNNCKNQNAYCRIEKRKKVEFRVTNEQVYILKNGVEEGGNVLFESQNGGVMHCFSNITTVLLKQIQDSLLSIKLLDNSLKSSNIYKGCFCNYPKLVDLEIDIIIQQFKEYISFIKNLNRSIINVICYYKEEYIEKQFFNNLGMDVIHDSLDIAFMVKIFFNINNEQFIEVFHDGSSIDRNVVYNRKLELEKFVLNSLYILKLKRVFVPTNSFKKIILDQSVAGTLLHEVIGHLSEADSVENLNNIKRGKRLTNVEVCVYDEAIEQARGYNKFDDEGTLSVRQILIQKGNIIGRLNTIATSNLYKEKACGNARSISYMYAPVCRMRHTSMQDGSTNLKDIIYSCDNCIYLVGSRGGTSGINFSISAKYGIVVHRGKAVGIVYNPILEGNVFKTLMAIKAVCNDKKIHNFYNGCGKDDQYPLPVSFSAPSLFFEGGFFHH